MPLRQRGGAPAHKSNNHRNQEQDDRNGEDDLRHFYRDDRNAAEAQDARDQCYDQKCKSPTKHEEVLRIEIMKSCRKRFCSWRPVTRSRLLPVLGSRVCEQQPFRLLGLRRLSCPSRTTPAPSDAGKLHEVEFERSARHACRQTNTPILTVTFPLRRKPHARLGVEMRASNRASAPLAIILPPKNRSHSTRRARPVSHNQGGQYVSLVSDRHCGGGRFDDRIIDTESRGGIASERTGRHPSGARTGQSDRKRCTVLLPRRLERSRSLSVRLSPPSRRGLREPRRAP